MNNIPAPPHKPLEWVGPSLDELLEMPENVRRHMGFALRFAQAGIKHDHAKPLKGFKGAGVLEVVYTVKFAGVVYVLHCFQKKAKKGIATPQATIELIKRRLKVAELAYERRSEDQ
jgi:phage-related protein